MLHRGEVAILDQKGHPIPRWRYRKLASEPAFWAEGTPYRLSITDLGAKRIG